MPQLLEETRNALDLSESEVPDELALADLVSRGLPIRSLESLIERGIPEGDIYRFVIPRRTLERRRATHILSPSESDRTERLAHIVALACIVLGENEKAVEWLTTRKQQFNDARPLDLIESNTGAKLVEDVLLRAYFGNVA